MRLECAAVGTPPPDIGWLHVSAKTFPHHWTVGSNGVLSTAAVKEEDAGVWKCNANNTGGLVHHYFHIVVKGECVGGWRVCVWGGGCVLVVLYVL